MPSPESREIRKTLAKDKLDDTPLEQKRLEWDAYAKGIPVIQGVSTEEEHVEGTFCLRLSSQNSLSDHVIVYMHGGGLTEGSVYTAREWTARLAKRTRLPVLSVNYRLAPEHPYPAALEDMQKVYKGLRQDGYDANKIFFAADSSGCNLALATLIALRDEGEPLPAAALLISPSVDLTLSGESFETRMSLDPLVSKEVLASCAEYYAQGIDLASPSVSPLFGNLSGLPNILIHVGDHEILLSDAVMLHKALSEAGGQVRLNVWDDMWHVWHYFPELPEAREALEEINAFIKQMFDAQ